jgi:DNA polymerase sigma
VVDSEIIKKINKFLKSLLTDEISTTVGETDLVHSALDEIWKAIGNQGSKLSAIRSLDIYGSTINGLAIRGNSDLDLAITVDD